MEISLPVREYIAELFQLHRRELDQLRAQHEREIDRRFRDQDTRVQTAYDEQNRRLLSMNEIREQLNSQADTFASKEIVEGLRDRLSLTEKGLNDRITIGSQMATDHINKVDKDTNGRVGKVENAQSGSRMWVAGCIAALAIFDFVLRWAMAK